MISVGIGREQTGIVAAQAPTPGRPYIDSWPFNAANDDDHLAASRSSAGFRLE
jgi:hypothetical protein